MMTKHPIDYFYGGRTSCQLELITYDEDSMRAKRNDVAMKEPSCVHYTIDGQDYGCGSDNNHNLLNYLLDSEIVLTVGSNL